MSIELSADQRRAHDAVVDWRRKSQSSLLTMGGPAGSGKTTTIAAIVESLRKRDKELAVAFACLTGKASLVLRSKLEAARVMRGTQDYCGTIHGLIYKPRIEGGITVGWEKVPKGELDYGLIVLDEASMPDKPTFDDLASYGIPIFAVGDHYQLPPVKGDFNLMENPDIRLEQIHRQAEGSPIIRVATMARLEGRIPVGIYGDGVFKTSDHGLIERLKDPKAGIVLAGTNRTRVRVNRLLRRRAGHRGLAPEVGEPIVCLRNDREAGVFNGMIGTLEGWEDVCPDPSHGKRNRPGADPNRKYPPCALHALGKVKFPGFDFRAPILKEQFGLEKTIVKHENLRWGEMGGLFDWAYCITTHKAQGSEADNVVVIEETDHMDEAMRPRWLYTAVTRARKKLAIVGR